MLYINNYYVKTVINHYGRYNSWMLSLFPDFFHIFLLIILYIHVFLYFLSLYKIFYKKENTCSLDAKTTAA